MTVKALLVVSTASSRKEASKIAKALLNKRLAACVNISSAVTSYYWWKGRQEKTLEVLLFIKTTSTAFPKIKKTICQLHSYEVPEVIALPISAASAPYLKWLLREIDTRRKAVL